VSVNVILIVWGAVLASEDDGLKVRTPYYSDLYVVNGSASPSIAVIVKLSLSGSVIDGN
jgi:hypothetical protein